MDDEVDAEIAIRSVLSLIGLDVPRTLVVCGLRKISCAVRVRSALEAPTRASPAAAPESAPNSPSRLGFRLLPDSPGSAPIPRGAESGRQDLNLRPPGPQPGSGSRRQEKTLIPRGFSCLAKRAVVLSLMPPLMPLAPGSRLPRM